MRCSFSPVARSPSSRLYILRSILSVNATGLSCAATLVVVRVVLFFSAIGILSFARKYIRTAVFT